MKRITKATFKSFIRKNEGRLYIRKDNDYDAMVDCIGNTGVNDFSPIKSEGEYRDHTLGYKGIWLVGNSRDYFKEWSNGFYSGIEYSNCCGSGIVAVKICQDCGGLIDEMGFCEGTSASRELVTSNID